MNTILFILLAGTLAEIKEIAAILGTVLIAYMTFKQHLMAAKQKTMEAEQKEIAVKVDGMTSKLVVAEKDASSARGELKGMESAKGDAASVLQTAKDAAMTVIKDAKDAAITVMQDSKTGVQEVKIVGQEKPVDVKDVDKPEKG